MTIKINKYFFLLLSFYFISALDVNAQKKFNLSGYVKDNRNGETLIGATVRVSGTNTGAVTNAYGFYSIALDQGKYDIKVSYLGYSSIEVKIELSKNLNQNFSLDQTEILSKEVVIKGERDDKNVRSTEISRIEISSEKIKALPVIMGESDVLKSITLLPGIKSGGEASTGFYVRGGGPDQNLILMDEATVYNPSHLFGFLSVFNTDAVKNIEIIKGGMPANYGGRLSSILNVNMREGNYRSYKYSGGIGLLSSRFLAEGPIKKDKSSFLIAGRRTYIDVLTKPFIPDRLKGSGYYFYDLNTKINFILGQKDRLFISGYFGRDVMTFTSPRNKNIFFDFGWGNSTATIRWNHVFSSKIFSNTSIVYNRYDLYNNFTFGSNGFNIRSGLADWNIKSDYTWFINQKHEAKFGFNYIYHTFTPGIASGLAGNVTINEELNRQYAHEVSVYALDEWKINSRFTLNAGLRGVAFNLVGPYTKKLFDSEGLPSGQDKTWASGESIAFYPGIEPRVNMAYLLNSNSSLKASYTQTFQFIHLATSSGAQFPVDLWVPSSQRINPQEANQIAVGYFRNFHQDDYEFSAETYYKKMNKQIEFKPGARLFFNQNLEDEMVFGDGRAYGLELFLRKKSGALNGWFGYTWSKATRQFDELNGGKEYLYRYDREHDLSLVLSYTISKKWAANFVFVYGTGNAVTLPSGRYAYRIGFDPATGKPDFAIIDLYKNVNSYRLPAYHRADISFTYLRKKTDKWESSWNFSIYNLYNRANPYFIYFDPNLETMEVKAYMVYLFPILPSISWNFKF